MSEEELRQQYKKQWEKDNPVQYLTYRICSILSFVFIAMMLYRIFLIVRDGLTGPGIGLIALYLVAHVVLRVICGLSIRDRYAGWEYWYKAHRTK